MNQSPPSTKVKKEKRERRHDNCAYYNGDDPIVGAACYRFPPRESNGNPARLNPATFEIFKCCGEHKFKTEPKKKPE